MKKYQVSMNIEETSKEYIDQLILGLVHSGYEVYFNWEKTAICFITLENEVIKLTKE